MFNLIFEMSDYQIFEMSDYQKVVGKYNGDV